MHIRIFKYSILILSIALLAGACGQGNPKRDGAVIYLESGELRAGILPEVGGRLVFLGEHEGPNLLYSDSALWNEDASERISPSGDAGMKSYSGHIIWPGPQSEWWIHQELNPKRRAQKSIWPPDPFLIYGRYQVLKQNRHSITMEGPPSPVSGISYTKTYRLRTNELQVEVCMKNTSDTIQTWDIWSNARFTPGTAFFVPGAELLRLSARENEWVDAMQADSSGNRFTFRREMPSEGKRSRLAKAFLHTEEGRIVAFPAGKMLVMHFPSLPKEVIHPEQALVEVYLAVQREPGEGLLELEHHSALVSLEPGESYTVREFWSIHDYPGGSGMEEQKNFYDLMEQKR